MHDVVVKASQIFASVFFDSKVNSGEGIAYMNSIYLFNMRRF